MLEFFRYHFAGLFRFSGREAVKPFWLWFAFNFAWQLVAMMAVMLPTMFGMFGQIEKFAAEHPDQVTRTYGPGTYSVQIHGYHPELMPNFAALFLPMGVIMGFMVLLLAAAVTRRLHDSDRSGAWGLMPLPFLTAGMILMPRLFSAASRSEDFNFGLFFALFANNMAYLGSLGLLAFLLSKKSTPGENRFGAAP